MSDSWIEYARPYAASQLIRTRDSAREDPRSTCHQCGSLCADDQRVDAEPSTANAAAWFPLSTLDADVGRFRDSNGPHDGGGVVVVVGTPPDPRVHTPT